MYFGILGEATDPYVFMSMTPARVERCVVCRNLPVVPIGVGDAPKFGKIYFSGN